jgi:competence protein ComGC
MKQIHMTKGRRQQAGFTLVELSMSLVFIAFVILFLITTLLNVMQTYNKGIWLNQINLAGRQINADIGDQVRLSNNTITINDAGQRLCVGKVVYLWNTAEQINNKIPRNWFGEDNTVSKQKETRLRFVRVLDNTGTYCNTGTSIPMPTRSSSNTSAMLGPGVIIQKFTVTESAVTGLLRIQAVFSTENDVQPELNPNTGNYQCKIAGKFTADNNQFCAFAEFDIIAYRRLGK